MRSKALDGIRLKLVRAEKHLSELLKLLTPYAEGECNITPEDDPEHKWTVLRINISPKADPELSVVAGDVLFNVRSALDHLIWQLVLNNPPAKPSTSNQFPICVSPEEFADAVCRKLLRGVPEAARTLIESLQPYNTGDNPLGVLNKLHNFDKHRTLNVITVVADNTQLTCSRSSQEPYLNLQLGNEELRDGATFGDIAVPFDLPTEFAVLRSRLDKMKMYGKCSIFVAFDDSAAEDLEGFRVDRTLDEILKYVRDTILPAFEPFFDGAADTI